MLSKNLEATLHNALNIARKLKHEYATLEHLLLALTDDVDAKGVLENCSVNIPILCEKLKYFLANELSALVTQNLKETNPTAGFKRVIHRAAIRVHTVGSKEVTGANVLAELFPEQESFAVYFLNEQHISQQDVVNYMTHGTIKFDSRIGLSNEVSEPSASSSFIAPEEAKLAASLNKDMGKETTSSLTNYCINLNKLAAEGKIDILVGRDNEIERTIEILCRRNKNNPLYVGEPGVGKTAIAEGLALRIVRSKVPDILKNAIVFALDMGSLVAGTRYRGDFEERMKSVIKEIQKIPGAILFIDEIHTIIGAGATSGGSLDAGNLLKPALARAKLRCIGATTYKEFQAHFEKDRALARRFQKIVVEEPTTENAIKILRGLKQYYEKHHEVQYTNAALEAAVTLSQRYINDRHLPDKAIDIIDEAGAHHKLSTSTKIRKTITVRDIENVISRTMHIPLRSITTDESFKLQHLGSELKKVIFGQEKAIEELSSAIKTSRAGLRNIKKPIGCYLFSGPTGVGKTELAKQLANLMHMELHRFDMSEYLEPHSVSKLIGSPPGYIGFDQGGLLSDAIYKTPYSVVLLDELEKAHSDIYNILLQIMDYGRLTDHNGRVISFCNTIIIMTTNAGAVEMSRAPLGFDRKERIDEDKDQIKKTFSPEFLNRLDAVIPFTRLDGEIIKNVVDKFIIQLEEQLADRGVRIYIDDNARNYLCNVGYDKNNGARLLDRVIDEKIKKYLADEILFGKLIKGGKVAVSLKNKILNFEFSK